MERRTFSIALVLACVALVCRAEPSVDPPSGYPGALRRAIERATDEGSDDISIELTPDDPSTWPIASPGIVPPKPTFVDPSQFVQMKATLLKNLFGPGGAKSPSARSAPPPKSSASGGKPKWGPPAPSSQAAPSSSQKSSSPSKWGSGAPAPAQAQAPAQAAYPPPPSSYYWPPTNDAPSQAAPSSSQKSSASSKYNSGTPAPAPAAYPPPPSSYYWPPTNDAPSQAAPAPASYPSQKSSAPSKYNSGTPAPASASSYYWPPPSSAPSQDAPAASQYPSQKSSAPSKSNSGTPAPAPSAYYWTPPTTAPAPTQATDKKTPLLEALLAEYLAEQQSAPARAVRTPIDAAPVPSPYLSELLDSLNISAPEPTLTLKPTIEPPGFWFPDVVANPGGLKPYAVDPNSIIAKKSKFISDLFSQKALLPVSPVIALKARAVDLTDYTTKLTSYLSKVLDATSVASKRSSGVEDIPEDERAGLRKKRDIGDETDVATPDVTTLASDLLAIKQNILLQLDAMQKARLAESKALRAAAKAAKAQAVLAAVAPGLAAITPTTAPPNFTLPVPLEEYQQRIALLTNLYSSLTDAAKNVTGTATPALPGVLSPEQLFISAVNDKVATILLKSAEAKVANKVVRSSGSYQRWRGQQDSPDNNSNNNLQSDNESENETSRRQKAAVPLVAAVFAPETHNYHNRQPYWWN